MSQEKKIVATEVPEARRLAFLPKLFGVRLMMVGEELIYRWAENLTCDYVGGLWSFYTLSNDSGYLAPVSPERFNVEVSGNGYEGEMSADAFGVTVTMYALNTLVFELAQKGQPFEALADKYHALREFAKDHAEASEIFAAID